ncbi:hypothetical protein [Hymenobacter edaphi]|uniref:Uncharacterized protein n=1 Tax=Hymenobacter edaphi TaxID=2211146 RepID=A0A328B7M7_9BACT|nr:hypothetical protein [Hymenobacter edaphi]RAK62421.1 hypothetical protein DLM85_23755 [Hymenobacter edaphi]
MNNKPTVTTHAGLTLDLAQIKCFKLSPFLTDGNDTRQLLVEYKTRPVYVLHPGTKHWEKEYLVDVIAYDFPSYESAQAHLSEWEEIWQDYLESQA